MISNYTELKFRVLHNKEIDPLYKVHVPVYILYTIELIILYDENIDFVSISYFLIIF